MNTHRTVISLDGEWAFCLDPDNTGKITGWANQTEPPAQATLVTVPHCWHPQTECNDHVAWYCRAFDVPSLPDGGWALLTFDAVNYLSEVWVNGEPAGSCEGGYTPFELDITDLVKSEAENQLVVRVVKPPAVHRLDGLMLKETACWRELESYTFGGIWQSVALTLVPKAHIADVFVKPYATLDAVTVDVTLRGLSSSDTTLRCRILDYTNPATVLVEQEQQVSSADRETVSVEIPFPDAKPWSPDSPQLYRVSVELVTPDSVDVQETRFGMRHLTMKDDRFYLNGQPLFIKGAFHEGLYPFSIPAPPSRAFVEDEMRKAKDCGFNLLRYWQIPIHPLVIQVADEMGLMLCNEPPVEWMVETDRIIELCSEEIRRMVMRDRNYPSVVIWNLLNEGSILCPFVGKRQLPEVEDLPPTRLAQGLHKLCLLTRELDPTRLIIDESGSWIQTASIFLPDETVPMPLNDVHRYIAGPTCDTQAAEFLRYGEVDEVQSRSHVQSGVPVFVSEFGYGSIPDLEAVTKAYDASDQPECLDAAMHRRLLEHVKDGFEAHHLDRIFESPDDLWKATQELHAKANLCQAYAIRSNPAIAGYVMHALSAGGCILGAEIFDMWRKPKPAMVEAVKTFNNPIMLAPMLSASVVEEGETLSAEVVLVNDAETPLSGTLSVAVLLDGKAISMHPLGEWSTSGRITTLWRRELPLTIPEGLCELHFTLKDGEHLIAEGKRQVWGLVTDDMAIPPVKTMGYVRPDFCNRYGNAEGELVVAATTWDDQATVDEAIACAKAGAGVLLVACQEPSIKRALNALGIKGETRGASGNWAPVSHYVAERSLLDGLPNQKILGEPYAGLLPWHTIHPMPEGTLAGTFSYQQGPGAWYCPEAFWFGGEIIERRVGDGKIILSTWALTDRAMEHPVAERLMARLLARLQS